MPRPPNTFSTDKELERLKHVDVAYSWMQDEIRFKSLRVRRVKSEENVADLETKPLGKAVIAKHCLTQWNTSTWMKKIVSARCKAWRCFGTVGRSKSS